MLHRFCLTAPLMMALMLLMNCAAPAFAEKGMAVDPSNCLGCHSDKISADRFGASVHGKNGCTSCHLEGADLLRHMQGDIKPGKVECGRCHKKIVGEYASSVHMMKGVGCAACHADIHSVAPWKNDKRKVATRCLGCHKDAAGYLRSVHGRDLLKGNQDSAACNDCHGLHDIRSLREMPPNEARKFHTAVCIPCHSNEEMMKRNNVSATVVETYLESYHGKSYRLGFPERAAGCADCHAAAHSILPKDDPASSVNSTNLVGTCARCHSRATALLTRFYAHGNHADRKNYPILYYTFLGMTGLLVSTFAVFWVHTLLWMFRGFVENRQRSAALALGVMAHAVVADGHKIYQRFQKRHILLHLTVIISFLGPASP